MFSNFYHHSVSFLHKNSHLQLRWKLCLLLKQRFRSTFVKENNKIRVKIISNYWRKVRDRTMWAHRAFRHLLSFAQLFHVFFPDPLGLQSLSEKWNPACVQAIHLGDILKFGTLVSAKREKTRQRGKEKRAHVANSKRTWYDWIWVYVILPCSLPAF